MLNKEYLFGVGLGILLTGSLAYLLQQLVTAVPSISLRERTIYLVAICFNALVVKFMQHRSLEERQKGMVNVTVVMALIWMLYYGVQLLS